MSILVIDGRKNGAVTLSDDRSAVVDCLATAVATAATTIVTGVADIAATIVIDQQQNDDDEQDPVAVAAAEQITQTHSFHPLTLTVYVIGGQRVSKTFVCISGRKAVYILKRNGMGGALCIGLSDLRKRPTQR